MERFLTENIEFYLENIPGVVVIDIKGEIIYLNNQCAGYFGLEKKDAMGKHILEVFPETKMIEGLNRNTPELVFYNSHLGIGITVQVPLFKNGKKVGLLEYDATQSSERLYELSKGYSDFLDRELKNVESEIFRLKNSKYSIANLIGESPQVVKMKEQIIAAAQTNSTVIIMGETGTGKELVAHAIHGLSARRKKRLIKINAPALPEPLVESELFGYEGGAFTGANKGGKKGKFELADEGTIFIDEINQMSMHIQSKLLRAIQEKEIDRVGGDVAIPIDVRLIAASNEDLLSLVKEGKFREDLYYRLNVIEIKVPPLRERIEDIEALTKFKIDQLNMEMSMDVQGISQSGIEYLKSYHWPGNIRELYNVVERAMNFAKGNLLTKEDFSLAFFKNENGHAQNGELVGNGKNLIEVARNDAERHLIENTLRKFNGNKTKAANYLGIARPLLYQKIKRLGI